MYLKQLISLYNMTLKLKNRWHHYYIFLFKLIFFYNLKLPLKRLKTEILKLNYLIRTFWSYTNNKTINWK